MRTALSIISLFVFTALSLPGQEKAWLFPEFSRAEIEFWNHSRSKAEINFDMVSQKLFFRKDGELMEVTNASSITGFKLSGRTFIMKEKMICEMIPEANDTIYVNWHVKNANLGSKGVYGLPTQGSVQVLSGLELDGRYSVTNLGKYAEQDIHSQEIWTQKNENTYFFTVKGKEYQACSLNSLYKSFPEHKAELKNFSKVNKLNMSSVENAFKVIHYLKKLYE